MDHALQDKPRIVVEDKRVVEIPPHVDPSLVVDFDYLAPPGFDGGDIYGSLAQLHDGPDIVWTPHHGGHWIATRADDTKASARPALSACLDRASIAPLFRRSPQVVPISR